VPHAKLGAARLELFGINHESVQAAAADLDMPLASESYGYPLTVAACDGLEYDRYALQDSLGMANAFERLLQAVQLPTPLSAAVSSSPLHKAETLVKDVGMVGAPGGWEIYVGGSARRTVRQGQLLCTEAVDRDALEMAAAFLQAYREQAYYGEPTWDWIERVGLISIRECLFNTVNRKGLLERLNTWRNKHDRIPTEWQPSAVLGQVK
jgi:nitrite reductase (NADH) large subunit